MATLTEVFPCFFLSCKANARVKPIKTGHGPHFLIFVLLYVLFVLSRSLYCLCVYVNCITATWGATQLQLNISYHMKLFKSRKSFRITLYLIGPNVHLNLDKTLLVLKLITLGTVLNYVALCCVIYFVHRKTLQTKP